VARLKTDLSIAVSPLDVQRAGPSTSASASGSFDVDLAMSARARRTPVVAIAAGLAVGAAATAFVLYTAAADEQVARAAALAAAGLSTSPSPTEPPPPVVKTIAFKVPAATARAALRISACTDARGKLVPAFTMDASDVPAADFDACVTAGTCPAVPPSGVMSGEHAHAYCRHAGRRALTTDEVGMALRALDAATFGLRCARVD